MDFLEKIQNGIQSNDEATSEPITLYSIRELLEEDGEYELEMFHGSKNFQGDKVDLNQAGSRRDQQNDANGTAFYMSSTESVAKSYAGANGQMVKGVLTMTMENVSNFCEPHEYEELIERAVLEAPYAFDYFAGNFEFATPYYDTDNESYSCPETGEDIECTLDEYLEKFGGLREVFKSRWFMPCNDQSANNPIDDFIAGSLNNYDSMYECLLNIEGELYCPNGDRTQEDVLIANKLNELKSEYGIQVGLVEEGDSIVAMITDSDALEVKEILQMKPASKPSTPKM